MLKNILSNQGAKDISFADSAESAVKIAQRKMFDIYLIDYNLGSGRNGSQLIEYLRKNKLMSNSAICFIISGDNDKGMVLTAIEKLPDDYLMKPFSQVQLSNRLNKASQKKLVLADIFDALEEKDYPLAVTLCKDRIDKNSKYRAICKHLLADIFIQTEQYTDAETILKPLVDQRPLVRASISLGKAYCLQGKHSEAIQLLKTVLADYPLQMEGYQWLAYAYKKTGNLSKALNILTHSANITHHSIERHQEVALLANEMNEHKLMLSSYAAILQLSRKSFYPDPCHLANYIRSIIDYSQQQKNIDERKAILKQVNSALYQSRFEEGQNKDFDFNNFDQICQAKVLFALEQPLKAKRKTFNTLESNDTPINELDNTFLCESLFSLLDLGEFEYAGPYLEELKQRDIIDTTTQAAIRKRTGKNLQTRMQTFKIHNQQGIAAFSEKSFLAALAHFEKALQLEPLNSGALLNRIQASIELLKESPKSEQKKLLIQCRESLSVLQSSHLPVVHEKRYNELQDELHSVKLKR